ncbi:GNAT family N-acetyltransferase [Clostridium tyrobutyricum]|uniref:GNAT family N-acetyltransferase n=1 Tax=Clostridium tyrobutyricum TaxID=1519 RepID=UPI00057D9AF2|nr:GNAT family N-acetyltransferase [Clostridium tyrobutyricum]
MIIKTYEDKYKNQVIALILYLQNFDNRVNLCLEEQPDMNDITTYYLKGGGGFWIAVNDQNDVVGTLGLMNKHNKYGVLKKFFVEPSYRGKEIGVSAQLFDKLMEHAKKCGMEQIVLDTPSACYRAHSFYNKMGFEQISKEQLPFQYDYPDRNSDIFIKTLNL